MIDIDIDKIWETVIAVLLAAAGGLARMLNKKDKRNLRIGRILSELFISGFAGIMMLMLARAVGAPDAWIGLACGTAGWIGPRVLDLIAKPSGKSVGIDVDERK